MSVECANWIVCNWNCYFVRLSGFPVGERWCPNPDNLGASEGAGESADSVHLCISGTNHPDNLGFLESQGSRAAEYTGRECINYCFIMIAKSINIPSTIINIVTCTAKFLPQIDLTIRIICFFVRLSGCPVGERWCPNPGNLGASECAGESVNSVCLSILLKKSFLIRLLWSRRMLPLS